MTPEEGLVLPTECWGEDTPKGSVDFYNIDPFEKGRQAGLSFPSGAGARVRERVLLLCPWGGGRDREPL